jgi:hypothetical protein
MCLTISIRAGGLDGSAQKELSDRFPALHRDRFRALRRGGGLLSVHACDFLSEEADWNAQTWTMTADGRRSLSQILTAVFARLPGDIEIEATWGGDAPTKEQQVSRASLLSLVESDGLGTRTRYQVSASQ